MKLAEPQPEPLGCTFLQTTVPCTCGELFQGSLDGEPCLVSCPIQIHSAAFFTPGQSAGLPLEKSKTRKALDLIRQRGASVAGVRVENPLPAGRGYGTSTADIGAVVYAANWAGGLNLTAYEIAQMAVEIEPTDSTLFDGLSLFAHRTAQFYECLGNAPAAQLLILDPGGFIDTQAFNARDWREALRKLAGEHRHAFELLRAGILNGDLGAIGEAATLSAELHQSILFNPLIEVLKPLMKSVGALGMCRAHSGTILGLLFSNQQACQEVRDFLSRRLHPSIEYRMTALTNGGPSYFTDQTSVYKG